MNKLIEQISRAVLAGLAPLLVGWGTLQAQDKMSIDTGMLDAGVWPHVTGVKLSPDGRYVSYEIDSFLDWRLYQRHSVVVEDTGRRWRRVYGGGGLLLSFSGDGREAIMRRGDSVWRIELGGEREEGLAVRSAGVAGGAPEKWLGYQQKREEEVVLRNLVTGKEEGLGQAESYQFGFQGKRLLLVRKEEENKGSELWWKDLEQGDIRRIWQGQPGEGVSDMVLDKEEEQVAFTVRSKGDGGIVRSLWYYRSGLKQAERRFGEGDGRLPTGSTLNGRLSFSANGRWVFFSLQQKGPMPRAAEPARGAKVDIWSYKDRVVQPEQLVTEGSRPLLTGVIGTDGQGLRVLSGGERVLETPAEVVTGDAVVISERDKGVWKALGGAFAYAQSYGVVSLVDGKCRWLRKDMERWLDHFGFSPGGKWLVYYDGERRQWYSYDMKAGTLRNITERLGVPVSSGYLSGIAYPAAGGIAGWWEGEDRVLLYDRYDLWGVDPSGVRGAVNITGGYGGRRQLQLRLLEDGVNARWAGKSQYRTGDSLLLCGFGERTKENGFLRQVLGHRGQPEVLRLEDCLYYQTTTQKPDGQPFDHGMRPVKASGANCWVVKRQTARESPNFYVTQDLRHYRAVSDERPELKYKWLKAELVNYKQLDGRPGQGILYKPEDFDEKKTYPVLYYYYEQLTHRLHEFPMPGYTDGALNIPWFVGHGYLVFTPDIHYEVGAKSGKTAGWWAYNAVESAAKYLSGLRYVDGSRMGLQGHSFGGFETNYIVTHSHRFGAAAEFSGPTDMISNSLSLALGTQKEEYADSRQSFAEVGQERLGATLWERRDLYEDASAVLWADRVSTPLLLVHNKKDGGVSWRQGVEWYLALRRLRKPSWMLQYDESNHTNFDRDARDYTLRLTQFFGYYLKGEPPPRWMTEGVPARLKGIDGGLELDTSGKKP